jgi:nicotinamide mononucleotide transporter
MLDHITENPIEAIAILCSLICVWLNIKQNIWGWFWAIISSALYAYVFYKTKLYSDMELQFAFIAFSIYGWWHWLHGGQLAANSLPVAGTPQRFLLPVFLLICVAAAVLGYLHQKYTDASLPYLDSTLTATSLAAQWLMARKYIENWLLWIAANIVYIYMYYSKGLYGTSLLYVLLLAMAIKGYYDWLKAKKISEIIN